MLYGTTKILVLITYSNPKLNLEGSRRAASEAKGSQPFYFAQSLRHSAPHQKYMPPVNCLTLITCSKQSKLKAPNQKETSFACAKGLGIRHHFYRSKIKITNVITEVTTPGGLIEVFLHHMGYNTFW